MSAEETAQLRREMRARRAALGREAQERDARAVCALLRGAQVYRRARVVMGYAAARGELSVDALLRDALGAGKTLLLPRCEANGRMTARRVRDMGALGPGAFGLLEPGEDAEALSPEEIDLILVPGVAFGRRGERIGQGGGYYDRFLPQSRAFRLGVCHGFALLDALEQREHDAKMDALATPLGLVNCGN